MADGGIESGGRRTPRPEGAGRERVPDGEREPSTEARKMTLVAGVPGRDAARLQETVAKKTVKEWMNDRQKQLETNKCGEKLDRAIEATSDLPQSVQTRWKGRLKTIDSMMKQKAADGTGDPLAITRFLGTIAPEFQQLCEIANASQDPKFQAAVATMAAAFESFDGAIGETHPALNTHDRYAWLRNSPVQKRTGELVRTGVVIASGLIALTTGILASMASEEDQNWSMPGFYLLVAALAAGWGEITKTSTERLGKQLEFLINADWEELAARGADWGQFAQNFFDSGSKKAEVLAFMKGKDAPTDKQKEAILALAPNGLRSQLETMMKEQSEDGKTKAAPLRAILAQLQKAHSKDAQKIAVAYINSGTTRQSLAMGKKIPGPGPI